MFKKNLSLNDLNVKPGLGTTAPREENPSPSPPENQIAEVIEDKLPSWGGREQRI